MDPLFYTGFRRELSQDDLYVHPSEADSEALLTRFNRSASIYTVYHGNVPLCYLYNYLRFCYARVSACVCCKHNYYIYIYMCVCVCRLGVAKYGLNSTSYQFE